VSLDLSTLKAEAAFHKALSAPARLKMLLALADGKEQNVRQLAAAGGISESQASQALGRLRTEGFLDNRVDGTFRLYSINTAWQPAIKQVARRCTAN